jgi:hypothetical protein
MKDEYKTSYASDLLGGKTVQELDTDENALTSVSTFDDVAEFIGEHGGIHGFYLYALTQEHLDALMHGDAVMLNIGGEYTGLLKLAKSEH